MAEITNQKDFIKLIDEILKRNKGGFTTQGYDVDPRQFNIAPAGEVRGKTLRTSASDKVLADLPPSRTPPTLPETELLPPETPPQFEDVTEAKTEGKRTLDRIDNTPDPVGKDDQGNIVLEDNSVVSPDGSITYYDETGRVTGHKDPVKIIADLGNGYKLFRDGSVKQVESEEDLNPFRFFEQKLQTQLQITQYMNERHGAYDIAVAGSFMEPLILPNVAGAKVLFTTQEDGTQFGSQSGHHGYGNSVAIQFPDGKVLMFAHLSQLNVEAGQILEPGQLLGITGNTGNSRGDHAHVEAYSSPEVFNQLFGTNRGDLDPFNLGPMDTLASVDVNTLPPDSRELVESIARSTDVKIIGINTPKESEGTTQQAAQNPVIESLGGYDKAPPQGVSLGEAAKETFTQQPTVAGAMAANPDNPINRGLDASQWGVERPGKVEGTIDRGNTELFTNITGIPTSPGKVNVGKEGSKLNLPELGSHPDGLSGTIRDALSNIGSKFGIEQEEPVETVLGASTTSKTQLEGQEGLQGTRSLIDGAGSFKDAIFKGLAGARDIANGVVKSSLLPEVGTAYAKENQSVAPLQSTEQRQSVVPTPGASSQGVQISGSPSSVAPGVVPGASSARAKAQTGKSTASSQVTAPTQSATPQSGYALARGEVAEPTHGEPEYYIKSLKLHVPESQMSDLTRRLYQMEQEGKSLDNNSKYAKLYKRYQDMFHQIQNQLPRELWGKPEANAYIRSQMTGSTSTGYSSPEADKQAQELKAKKEKFYSKGGYGDDLSYEKLAGLGFPSKEKYLGQMGKDLNVDLKSGSATKYSYNIDRDDKLRMASDDVGTFPKGAGKFDVNTASTAPISGSSKGSKKLNSFLNRSKLSWWEKLNPFR